MCNQCGGAYRIAMAMLTAGIEAIEPNEKIRAEREGNGAEGLQLLTNILAKGEESDAHRDDDRLDTDMARLVNDASLDSLLQVLAIANELDNIAGAVNLIVGPAAMARGADVVFTYGDDDEDDEGEEWKQANQH